MPTSRAGTPISTQIGCRLGVTLIDVETDILRPRPVHVCVERRLTLVTYVQATLDALAVVFSTAHTTRLVLLVSRSDTSTTSIPSTFALYVSIDVNRSNAHAVQVKLPVLPPVCRLAVLFLTDTTELPNIELPNLLLNTLLDDVLP
ncbi:MAG: hypothetical protein J07HQW2_01208 [Haloquadratum walsbyi J07HQW2]|uniref:Uncharacterized protein n=1 Tax=Haloquadratum walsbyi J07HQW2 TaxID=1238425 RepID=U1PR04_9EURY|nr:MAG: hypothetical protein J07HQW2_01208 [Haloquadratum walsbyi J07HQW2]